MRILYISDVYFPRVNGVSTSIQMFSQYLQRQGHEVDIIAPEYGDDEVDKGNIMRVPARQLFFDREDRFMSASYIMALEQTLKARNYDVIHIHTPFVAHFTGYRLARLLGIPCVETFHTHFEAYAQYYFPWLPAVFSRWLARRLTGMQCNAVDLVVAPSSTIKLLVQEYGVRKPIHVVSTGILLSEFRQGDGDGFRNRHGIDQSAPLLLSVGRIAHEKNIGFLLRVMRHVSEKMPEAILLIAGEGPARTQLNRMAENMGIGEQVRFIGYLSREQELADCYHAADAFVFASRTETQGLVLVEAMASGLPVISTAFLGTKEVLMPCKGGALICEENETEFANGILAVLRNPSVRSCMSESAREYSRLWDVDIFGHRMMKVYTDLLASHGGQREAVPV